MVYVVGGCMTNIGWAKITQGAKYAGVSERTFRAWLKAGLPFAKPPVGPNLVYLKDIDAFLKKHTIDLHQVDELVDSFMRGL